MGIPPLAGICTYPEAAKIGYSVARGVELFRRYAWSEKRMMEAGLYWINPTPEWEVKEALSYHVHLAAEHVGMLRRRIGELRSPMPRMDISPGPALDVFFDELLSATGTLEKLVGLYGVLVPGLLAAYQQHLEAASPIVDQPSCRMLRILLADEEEILAWGLAAIDAVIDNPDARERAQAWLAHLAAYLQAAGGVAGDEPPPAAPLPEKRSAGGFHPDFFPQRDERFPLRWNFLSPQREVSLTEGLPADERTLALMCRRAIEMDVPEYMSRIIAETPGQPWEFYMEMCRQLWDEARHAMLGTIYFEAHGIDWKGTIALHPGMSIRLNQYLSAREAHAVLYAVEQGLMPAEGGKKTEYEITASAQDPLAQQFQDYDWADEVLHVHIGRKWLLPALGMRREAAIEMAVEKRRDTIPALDAYTHLAPQENWWPAFVRQALGKESAMQTFDLTRR